MTLCFSRSTTRSARAASINVSRAFWIHRGDRRDRFDRGPIIGTGLYFLLREFLADLGAVYLMILGFIASAIMLTARKGIWGLVSQRFGLSIFPIDYRVTGAANADDRSRKPATPTQR